MLGDWGTKDILIVIYSLAFPPIANTALEYKVLQYYLEKNYVFEHLYVQFNNFIYTLNDYKFNINHSSRA